MQTSQLDSSPNVADSPKSTLQLGLLMCSINTLTGTTSNWSFTYRVTLDQYMLNKAHLMISTVTTRDGCPPHQIWEQFSRSHVSHLPVLFRRSVQSEAVQARLQLFHLFTRDSFNIQPAVCAKKLSGTFHAPAPRGPTAAGRPRRELFNNFTLRDGDFVVNKQTKKKALPRGRWCVCVCVCDIRCCMKRCVILSPWRQNRGGGSAATEKLPDH